MHDLIHDLAESISSPTCCQVKENELCGFNEKSRHVSLVRENVEEPMSTIVKKARKLRSLLLPSGHFKKVGQALDELFHTLKFIHVLDLSSCMISELPDSVEKLKLLHYLDLSRIGIKVLPKSICNLFRLQTLKLLGCLWLSELPKDLGNLVNLRHLELDGMFWFKSSILPPRLGKFVSLHNLPVFPVGHEDGYGIEQLERMANLSGTLHISKLENVFKAGDAKLNEKKSLEELVLEWTDKVVNEQDEAAERSVLEDLQPHSNLKELQILRYRGSGFPAWMEEGRLRNLVCLTLNGCIKCKILNLGRLPHLRKLYVKHMRELEIWTEVECDDWMEVECHSLYHLKLSGCPKLKELPSIFPKLKILKIRSCDSLMALPKAPSLMNLTLIDNLALENWNEELIQIQILPMEGDNQGQHEIREIPSLVQVFELKVKGCPKLQALPRFFFPEKLEISGCDLLRTLPPEPHACCLKHLALDACDDGELVRAIPHTTSLYSLVISSISNLSSLPTWPQLPHLKALHIHDCKDLVSLSVGEEGSLRTLTSLELLSIRNCQMLETLSEALPTLLQCLTIASCPRLESLGSLLNLSSLKDLYIEDCCMLQALPNDGFPNSLQHLLNQKCPLLVERCQMEGGGGPDWPKIENIPDLEIDSPKAPSTSGSRKRSSNANSIWDRRFLRWRGVADERPN